MAGKPWQSRLGLVLVPALGRPLLNLYWATLRRRGLLGREHLERLEAERRPAILSYWHEMNLLGARLVRDLAGRGWKIGALVSPSSDGEIAARLGRGWVAETIRASSSRTGARGLRDLHAAVTERGISPLITADGPRGPRREFKPGAVLLARATGAPILPLACAASRAWRLDSWDRFQVPKPLARTAWAVGEPRFVDRAATLADVAAVQRELESTFEELIGRARAAIGAER